jgi:hypothetical protein
MPCGASSTITPSLRLSLGRVRARGKFNETLYQTKVLVVSEALQQQIYASLQLSNYGKILPKRGDIMNVTKEYVLVAPCGLSCVHCPAYLSKHNPAIMEYLITMGARREDLPCQGCRPLEGKPAWCRKVNQSQVVKDIRKTPHDSLADGGLCATYACSVEHGVDFCYECPEFPCVKLQPCADIQCPAAEFKSV